MDRVPISFWGHDYMREWSAAELAATMLERHYRYDWDWMKLNPRACHAEPWGGVYRPSGYPDQEPPMLDYPVKEPSQLDTIERIDPRNGPLAELLEAVARVKEGIDAPFVQTVFSPLSILRHLVGRTTERVMELIVAEPSRVHRALGMIADTVSTYAAECLDRGASGIFYATTFWAHTTSLTSDSTWSSGDRTT